MKRVETMTNEEKWLKMMRHVEKDGKLWVESKTFGVAEM